MPRKTKTQIRAERELAYKTARIALVWALYTEACVGRALQEQKLPFEVRDQILDLMDSAHLNASDTIGFKNELTEEYALLMMSTLEGGLTAREILEETKAWFAARGVIG